MKIKTVADVDDLHTRLASAYVKCRTQWDYDKNLYFMDHYADYDPAAPGEERVMVNKATNVVGITHALLSQHPPKITARPITPSHRSDKTADRVEKFVAGAIYVNNIRLQEHQIAKAIFDQALYGRGALFSGWDPNMEGDDDEYSELPLIFKYVNHQNLYCLPGGHKRDIAQMYAVYRTAEDMQAEWGKRIRVNENGKTRYAEDTDEFIYKDLWWFKGGDVWHCVTAGSTWLRRPVKMPYYNALPYTEMAGLNTTSPDLHLRFLGVLYPLREAISILERWINQQSSIIAAFADPVTVADKNIEVIKEPGAVIHVRLQQGERISDKYMVYPPTDAGAGVYRSIQMAQQMVEEGSFSRYAYANVNPESGPVLQGMNANDRMRLAPFVKNAELAISAAVQKLLDCAYAFAESDGKERKLQVFSEGERSAVAISAKDLKGWLVTAKLSTKSGTDEARDWAIAANARQAGLPISDYTLAQTKLGIEQPEDEERRRNVEMFKRNPQVIELALKNALEEISGEHAEQLMPGLAKPPPQGPNAPRPTGPPTTAVSPQGMGQPMPPLEMQQSPQGPGAMAGLAPGAPQGMGP